MNDGDQQEGHEDTPNMEPGKCIRVEFCEKGFQKHRTKPAMVNYTREAKSRYTVHP